MKATLVLISGFVALGILAGGSAAITPDTPGVPAGPTQTAEPSVSDTKGAVRPKPSPLSTPVRNNAAVAAGDAKGTNDAQAGAAKAAPLLVLPAPVYAPPAPGAAPLDPAPDGGGLASGLMGGASFYYVRPYLPNNTAYRTTTLPGTPGAQIVDTTFGWKYMPAGAFWLGWTPANGLGFRARYFFYDQTSSTLNVTNGFTPPPQTTITVPTSNFLPLSTGGLVVGSPGTVLGSGFGTDHLAFASTLQINAVDVEATYGWQGDGWWILAGAGARYETLDQGYHARLANNGNGLPIAEAELFDATRNFSGGGPLASLLAAVRIGQTNFSLYGSLRGAVLVGANAEHVNFNQTVLDPTGLITPGVPLTTRINPTTVRNGDRVLSVAEFELGVQYNLNLSRSNLYFRAGVVDHNYFDAGNASQSTGNLGLFGVQFTAGIRR